MLKNLLIELKRRHVICVASVYVVVAWAIPRGAENFFPALTLPAWTGTRERFVELTLLVGVVLIIGLSIFQLSRTNDRIEVSRAAGEVADRSLAVPPFTSFSSEPDSSYFADGVTEELIHDHDAPTDKLVRAKALAQLGRNDGAMQELAAAHLQGFRALWNFDHFQRLDRLPWFAGVRNDERFRAFIAAIDADNRAMAAHCEICGA